LVSGSGDKTLRVWDMDSGRCKQVIKGHTGEVFCVKFIRNTIVSGAADKTLRLWDLESSECLKIMAHPEAVYACEMTETFIWSGCGDPHIRMWDVKSGECLRVIKAHTDGIYSIQLQGDKLVTGSIDKTAAIWTFLDDYNKI